MRFYLIALATASSLAALDPSAWIAEAGGAVTRDRNHGIVFVDLRASWVTDSDLAELAALPHLVRLDLSLTRITDHGLLQLKNAAGIEDLNLYYDELITDAGLTAVNGWKHLKRLNVRGTKATDAAFQQLAGVTSLEALDAGYALITDVGLDALASLPNLKVLSIGGNKLTDNGLQPLRQMPGLTDLDLSGSQRTDSGLWSVSLTERGMDAVGTLRNLQRLCLSGTGVSAAGIERLRGLSKLERLDLERCRRVGDDAIELLSSLKTLRRLDLTGAAVSAKGVAQLRRALPGCTIIAGEADAVSPAAAEPR